MYAHLLMRSLRQPHLQLAQHGVPERYINHRLRSTSGSSWHAPWMSGGDSDSRAAAAAAAYFKGAPPAAPAAPSSAASTASTAGTHGTVPMDTSTRPPKRPHVHIDAAAEGEGTPAEVHSGRQSGKSSAGKGKPATHSKGGMAHLEEAVLAQGRLLLRVDAEQRRQLRERQFILVLAPTATALRTDVARVWADYNARRDETPHPFGTFVHFMWCFMWGAFQRTPKPDGYSKSLTEWLDSLVEDEGRSVDRFLALGRGSKVPEGPWYWAFQFSATKHQGRYLASECERYMERFDLLGCELRKDTGAPDSLVRDVQRMTLTGNQAGGTQGKRKGQGRKGAASS